MEVDSLTGLEVARRGLYVHFPYCLRRCPYCDFTIAIARSIPGARYAEAVLAELRLRLAQRPAWSGQPLDSIYFGGGTPSLWDAREVGRVLQGFAAAVPLAPDAEISLEANPEVADTARLSGYRAAGVNRLSLGIQSFDPAVLKTLGRSHSPGDAEGAFRAARTVGSRTSRSTSSTASPDSRSPGRSRMRAERRRSDPSTCRRTCSPWTATTLARRRCSAAASGRVGSRCPTSPRWWRWWMPSARCSPRPASSGTRSPATRSPAGTRDTTRSTGPAGNRSRSAPARSASTARGAAPSAPPTSAARHAGSRRWRRAGFPTRSARRSGPRPCTRSGCCSGCGYGPA